MKIAVVGSGISGLSSAYYLSKKHKVDLFEKQDRFGGHSYTLEVEFKDSQKVAVDIGFMVFNKVTYPNLIKFFKENEIEIEKSDMSFSVNVKETNIDRMGYEPAIVYLNGDYWGLYGIREKIDEHYVESNHGMNSEKIDLLNRDSALAGSSDHFMASFEIIQNTIDDFFEFKVSIFAMTIWTLLSCQMCLVLWTTLLITQNWTMAMLLSLIAEIHKQLLK